MENKNNNCSKCVKSNTCKCDKLVSKNSLSHQEKLEKNMVKK